MTKLNANKKLTDIEVTDNDGKTRSLAVDGLFVAVGRVPATRFLDGVVEMDEGGYIKAGEDCVTNVPVIFVAGDNRAKEIRQLVTATSDGAIAAMNAVKFIG